MKLTYLLVNFFSVIIPFIFSFHSRLGFYRYWKPFLIANITVAIPFLIWDILFTAEGVWGFNEEYLLGIHFLGLPLEEYLFFICIPYACVFTWHCFHVLINMSRFESLGKPIGILISVILILLAIVHSQNSYTIITFLTLSVTLLVLVFSGYGKFLGKFIIIYTILLLPFFIINGILTGSGLESQVVWYNDLENMGIRIFTIPLEDTFYGMLLILSNIFLFEKLKESKMINSHFISRIF